MSFTQQEKNDLFAKLRQIQNTLNCIYPLVVSPVPPSSSNIPSSSTAPSSSAPPPSSSGPPASSSQ